MPLPSPRPPLYVCVNNTIITIPPVLLPTSPAPPRAFDRQRAADESSHSPGPPRTSMQGRAIASHCGFTSAAESRLRQGMAGAVNKCPDLEAEQGADAR